LRQRIIYNNAFKLRKIGRSAAGTCAQRWFLLLRRRRYRSHQLKRSPLTCRVSVSVSTRCRVDLPGSPYESSNHLRCICQYLKQWSQRCRCHDPIHKTVIECPRLSASQRWQLRISSLF
jgi:hypothetical protein